MAEEPPPLKKQKLQISEDIKQEEKKEEQETDKFIIVKDINFRSYEQSIKTDMDAIHQCNNIQQWMKDVIISFLFVQPHQLSLTYLRYRFWQYCKDKQNSIITPCINPTNEGDISQLSFLNLPKHQLEAIKIIDFNQTDAIYTIQPNPDTNHYIFLKNTNQHIELWDKCDSSTEPKRFIHTLGMRSCRCFEAYKITWTTEIGYNRPKIVWWRLGRLHIDGNYQFEH